ncbi:MAG TPA: hypothetical protein VJ183_11675 [Chloroflexia bacterium]|nr:hypothetical protein [Chloroflexia bacterium]
MDSYGDMEVRVRQVLDGIEEGGPDFYNLNDPDVEAQAISKQWNIPVGSVISVKYLADRGPFYDEMLDNRWNAAEWYSDSDNSDGAVDETICIYWSCDGYQSDPRSHAANCPYNMARELIWEWRQALP